MIQFPPPHRQLCRSHTRSLQSPGTGRRRPLAQAGPDICFRWEQAQVSLAHRGVLFLDELPEFGNRMLEMLRQPLDPTGKVVSISRSAGSLTYPANFTLVASMNPCPCGPCGSDPDQKGECTCSMSMVKNYPQGKRYPAR